MHRSSMVPALVDRRSSTSILAQCRGIGRHAAGRLELWRGDDAAQNGARVAEERPLVTGSATWPGLLSSLPEAGAGWQSVLAPASLQAERIVVLWWVMLAVACLVFLAVMAILLIGVFRARRDRPARPLDARRSRRLVIAGGVILPVVVIVPFVASSFSMGALTAAAPPADALTIEIVGRQWWWEVHYQDDAGRRVATTANEIHVPVGRPVRFLLTSDNVIHSFWVPRLQGKTDMVPGQVNVSWLEADRPGVYRGQCAEFCGVQHALMAFLLVAQPADAFEAWLQRQQRPAPEPATREQARGRDVFLASSCGDCHAVRGTAADAAIGPDLTHVGGRRMLAAATIGNTTGHLGGWIADPQHVKPGNGMPPTALSPDELKALIRYLESLQ